MPIFRGLEISVVCSSEAKKLPEYPHPEGASVRLVAAGPANGNGLSSPQPSQSSIQTSGDPTRQKVNPRIAVYIPSVPGAHFWLQYNVLRLPSQPPTSHLYFKLFMNGRAITSWGILADRAKSPNPNLPISGSVTRALYEPSPCFSKDGVGIEYRYFNFKHGMNHSVAEDGGLIEVRVYRSKGRKRRAPRILQFREQEKYGLTSPSGGMVPNPEDTAYYDWLLIDPKDAPYATFCFHYRSMENLRELSLIPQSLPRNRLLDVESSISGDDDEPDPPETSTTTYPQFSFGVIDTTVFDDNDKESRTPEEYFLRSPPELLPATSSYSQPAPQPSKTIGDGTAQEVLQRPLPEPPTSKKSRPGSSRSSCPSLTPSLAQYVDDGDFGDEEIEIGVAKSVLPSHPSLISLPGKTQEDDGDDSASDYEHSPPSTASRSSHRMSPRGYLSTTGSVLERQIETFSSLSPRRGRGRLPISSSDGTFHNQLRASTFNLSESEWMRRTPSPTPRKLSRLWSPQPQDKKANDGRPVGNWI